MLFIQMFSMVSFAMLFSLLTLYCIHVLHFPDQKAYDISDAFNAQVFAMAVLGGYISNRFLGYHSAFIFSGILMSFSLILLLSTNTIAFYYGLAIYILAQGIMFPSIFVLLGMLYQNDHAGRDSGFIVSYIGMNIGSFTASIFAGPISENYGYWVAFFIGFIFSVITLINYILHQYQFKPKVLTALTKAHANSISRGEQLFGMLIIFIAIPFLAKLIQFPHWNNLALTLLGLFCLLLMIKIMLAQKDKQIRNRLFIFICLNIFSLAFWALYLLTPTIMPLFTERNIDRHVLGHLIPTASFIAANPLFVMLLGPCFSIMWLRLAKRGINLSTATKFSIGFLLMAAGYLILAVGTFLPNLQGSIPWPWLIASYALQTAGELFVAPIGLAMVGVLAPRKYEGLMMGIWQLSTGVAGVFTDYLSKLVNFSSTTSLTPQATNLHYAHLFLLCGILMTVVGLITVCLLPFLNRLLKSNIANS